MKEKIANRKLRILWCGEASFLNTGYSIYAKEVLSRLHETGKYEIAELACYAYDNNPEIKSIPWKVYPNMPSSDEQKGYYDSNQKSQFGEWRFESCCLDFMPDVVIDIRDWWMIEFEERSPFRKFYKWVIMPTVDSMPQQEQYLSTYMNADAVFTYSEFGKDVLESESNENIKVVDIASPAADYESLKPSTDKKTHKSRFGFVDGVNIVGTVMRNQRRKLYPNLISSFRKMLDDNIDLCGNTFLYIHTSYPDVGWDIPYYIKKYNMSGHTLLTYKCKSCGYFFPSFYSGVKTPCPKCASIAQLPNTSFGLSTKELGAVMNFFDLYVQYSICEGFGMPQVEAAACGVPLLTVNYSAMESVGKNLKADFIDVKSFFWDTATQSQRAIPDDDQLSEKMAKFLKLPVTMRIKKGMDSYIKAKKVYSWDKTALCWEKYLDSIDVPEQSETWMSPAKINDQHPQMPENLNNESFVSWLIDNILKDSDKNNSYMSFRLLRDLNCGQRADLSHGLHYDENSQISAQKQQTVFTQKSALDMMLSIVNNTNEWEKQRAEMIERRSLG